MCISWNLLLLNFFMLLFLLFLHMDLELFVFSMLKSKGNCIQFQFTWFQIIESLLTFFFVLYLHEKLCPESSWTFSPFLAPSNRATEA